MLQDIQRLKEMGIPVWQLRKPEIYGGEQHTLSLPDTCKLLFVCDQSLNETDAWLFGRILKSMDLLPEQALQLPHAALESLAHHELIWCWYIGQPQFKLQGVNVLTSTPLADMQQNPSAKKHLWQQICSYDV